MFCVTSTATASSLLSCDVKRLIPAFDSGKLSKRKVSSSFKKQTTKFVLCKSTPIYLTSLVLLFCRRFLIKKRNYSVYFHTPIRDQKKSHTVLRVRVLIGHTVSRDHLCHKASQNHCRPSPRFLLATSEKYRKHYTPILLLVSRPVMLRRYFVTTLRFNTAYSLICKPHLLHTR